MDYRTPRISTTDSILIRITVHLPDSTRKKFPDSGIRITVHLGYPLLTVFCSVALEIKAGNKTWYLGCLDSFLSGVLFGQKNQWKPILRARDFSCTASAFSNLYRHSWLRSASRRIRPPGRKTSGTQGKRTKLFKLLNRLSPGGH